jgi:hypothetical protein
MTNMTNDAVILGEAEIRNLSGITTYLYIIYILYINMIENIAIPGKPLLTS